MARVGGAMKIRINDKALLKEIAEVCYDELCMDLGNGRSMYGLFHDLIEEKVAKLIEENKDTILARAASMVAVTRYKERVGYDER